VREANRRAACERLVGDPAASDTEKAVAAKELEKMGPPPPGPVFTQHRYTQYHYTQNWGPFSDLGPFNDRYRPRSEREPTPAEAARAAETSRRAEEDRRTREDSDRRARLRAIVNDQRRRVESLPFWREDPTLVGAHDCEEGWGFMVSPVVNSIIDTERDVGVSATDEPGRVALLAAAWNLADLTDQERAWLRMEMERLSDCVDVSPRFLRWLARRAAK
jgi:hypothetical protein